MRKNVLFVMMYVLMTAGSLTVNAVTTRSVGYKLWDSNNAVLATTDPSELSEFGIIMHIQIKFDRVIHIDPDLEPDLRTEFDIRLPQNQEPEDNSRNVTFGINEQDPTVLDITIASEPESTPAQTNGVISVKANDPDGRLTIIKDADNNPVILHPFTSVQPTGLALEKVSSTTGTAATPASVTCRMSSIPLVRGMNFLQAQSNRSANPNGYLSQEYFTIHSHNFYGMTARTHFTNLLTGSSTQAAAALQQVGYTLELIEVPDNTDNPHLKLTALAPAEGEELSWIVYHYPYRSPADRKFELAQRIESSQAGQAVIEAAKTVLYNSKATAEDVLAAIATLGGGASGIAYPETTPRWNVVTGDRSVNVQGLTPGSIVTVYRINGRIAASIAAESETETIPLPSTGIYIVRVNDSAVKIFVR